MSMRDKDNICTSLVYAGSFYAFQQSTSSSTMDDVPGDNTITYYFVDLDLQKY